MKLPIFISSSLSLSLSYIFLRIEISYTHSDLFEPDRVFITNEFVRLLYKKLASIYMLGKSDFEHLPLYTSFLVYSGT